MRARPSAVRAHLAEVVVDAVKRIIETRDGVMIAIDNIQIVKEGKSLKETK
jgi:chaperonin GroEL (HSP60 family)